MLVDGALFNKSCFPGMCLLGISSSSVGTLPDSGHDPYVLLPTSLRLEASKPRLYADQHACQDEELYKYTSVEVVSGHRGSHVSVLLFLDPWFPSARCQAVPSCNGKGQVLSRFVVALTH